MDRLRHRTRFAACFGAVLLALSACGSSVPAAAGGAIGGGTVNLGTLPPPPGLPAFYGLPRQLPGGPGKVIRSEAVDAPGVHGSVYRVMYVSEDESGRLIPVTGVLAVPRADPPSGGFPVVSWAHGTNGMATTCAPSLSPVNDVGFANALLDAGMEVVASDYQGEGTPGPLPYLVGLVAARNTVDIVRAARQLAFAHASADYAVWGHSEGGQTAMFALQSAPSYAPELHMVGVVAGAAPSQFRFLYQFLTNSPFRYYLVMAAVGFHQAYGTAAPLDEVLTPTAQSLIPQLESVCSTGIAQAVDRYSMAELVTADPYSLPDWSKLIDANDPGNFTAASPVPLLMPQGGADEQIPVASTQLLAQHLCALGQDLERWIYPGQSHAGVLPVYLPDMVRWLSDRFSGAPAPDPMTPTGESGVQTTTCA